MKSRMITARVDDHVNFEIEYLKSSLGLTNTTSVVTYAVHTLFETVKDKQTQKTSLEMFEESGLLGCFEGTSDLSTNYKDEISKVVVKKLSPSRRSSKKTHKRNPQVRKKAT